MAKEKPGHVLTGARLAIIGLVAVVVILGFALVLASINRAGESVDRHRVDALAESDDACVQCHRQTTPGIVEQYGHSSMAAADVTCQACHEVAEEYPGAVAHEGTFVLGQPSTGRCQRCHHAEVEQFYMSRHALPAYVAYAGTDALTEEQRAQYDAIIEARFQPDRARNALHRLEGPAITRFACEGCHNVGRPAADGTVGECQACHLRHEFSLEQVRRPETCNACHIGPDHPQWEIYQESPHGIAYATGGHRWNWEAEPGTVSVTDFPAPTCSTCHFSGFGTSGTTHDVGDRLSWYLFAPISQRRDGWEENQMRMRNVCRECHNETFVETFFADADAATLAVNDFVVESNDIMAPLREQGLLTPEPFDQTIDFVHFDLWHHWGRTTKFGAWMQGPDYSQWHGAYEILRDMAHLREMAAELLSAEHEAEPPAQPPVPATPPTPAPPTTEP